MDKIDYDILKILKSNGRISHEKIAQDIKLSRPAVRARIVAMEKAGIIEGYSTKLNYDALGFNIQVFVYVKLMNNFYRKVIKEIYDSVSDELFIDEYFRISGEWCLIFKVMCHSQVDITQFVDKILKIEGIIATNTVLIFKS